MVGGESLECDSDTEADDIDDSECDKTRAVEVGFLWQQHGTFCCAAFAWSLADTLPCGLFEGVVEARGAGQGFCAS